jgi:L-aspartate oxidase
MGGIATDTWGRTSIPGLFAVGEVACTGAHGANRLASNSLLESLVFSKRAVSVIHEEWPQYAPDTRFKDQVPISEIVIEVPSEHKNGGSHVVDRVELQTLMWDSVGLARTHDELLEALNTLSNWRPAALENRLFTDWEDANLLLLAHAVTASALARHESRGSHYRLDYPQVNPTLARPITLKRKLHDA